MNILLKIKNINKITHNIFFNLIVFYQKIVSPVIPARCRYYPTCSNYGKQALIWYGARKGIWLLLKRLSRCHPLGGHGIDFVPLPLASYSYQYISFTDVSNTDNQGLGVYRDNTSYVSQLNYLMKST
ncbi:membrane protein insertion efficiency factor YidD [Psychrobacter sp. APC 3279]|uniref:membrane protein insertion efficiency factor YidD n=1 Tax=unclassified Psychrobacter TaxID=196806 RepID=UPI0019183573|nr:MULTISPECIES: membrane protein insertion efficiency factor YidD [unclassified Psychrobacter]MDN3441911.1 membrane protein insertion efficiency factor YidD [Psychrobacter sp. APC 3279]